MESFTNYVDKILSFFDHLPPYSVLSIKKTGCLTIPNVLIYPVLLIDSKKYVEIFYGINVDKKWTFLDHLPTLS